MRRLMPRHVIISIVSICCFTVILFNFRNSIASQMEFAKQRAFHTKMMALYGSVTVKSGESGCKMQILKLHDPVFDKYFSKNVTIKCDTLDWVYAWNGVMHFDKLAVQKYGFFSCNCEPITRKDEYNNIIGPSYKCRDGTQLTTDFTTVVCETSDHKYITTVSTTVPKDDVIRRTTESVDDLKDHLNVLMFGLDSVSRLAMIRKLPKTVKYFEELGGKFLERYNIVGDGTPQNLLPMLCGKTEIEMPNTRKRYPIPESSYVNVYPFIWNDFKGKGYVTLESQDNVHAGTYQYRLNGFKEQPTDHYQRNYFVATADHSKCIEGKPRYQVQFNYSLDLFETYLEAKKFTFTHSDMCHDEINTCGAADDYFVWLLRYFSSHGYLSNTVIILYSDHGARFSTAFTSFRNTPQGKLEERLPAYGILLPSWFGEKYPVAYRNFRINAKERLITPFNIYGTLLRFVNNSFNDIDNDPDINNRQLSIFDPIPIERSCMHADVEPHWCACLDWQEVPLSDPTLLTIARAFIATINDELKVAKKLCSQLSLNRIIMAQKYSPNNAVLAFKNAKDADGFIGHFNDDMKSDVEAYQIKVQTTPGDAVYEASMSWNVQHRTTDIDLGQCSILTKYSENAKCVINDKDVSHLRYYDREYSWRRCPIRPSNEPKQRRRFSKLFIYDGTSSSELRMYCGWIGSGIVP